MYFIWGMDEQTAVHSHSETVLNKKKKCTIDTSKNMEESQIN